jgi:hypothetical protein
MISKNEIIKNFISNMDDLFLEIDRYHSELVECKLLIEQKDNEIKRLREELDFIKQNNKGLCKKNQKNNQNFYEPNLSKKEVTNNISSSFKLFLDDSTFITNQNELTIGPLLEQIDEILVQRNKNYSSECILLALKIMNNLFSSPVKEQVQEYFRYKHSSFEGNVYEQFSFILITELLKSYMYYGKRNELIDIYLDVITDFNYFSSEQLDSIMFTKFLWYGFYLGNEEEFLNCVKDNSSYFNENKAEIKLYRLAKDIFTNKILYDDNKLQVNKLINEINDFDPVEKKLIFNFLLENLSLLTEKNHKKVDSVVSVKKTPRFSTLYFCEDAGEKFGFVEKEILFAIFGKPDINSSSKKYFLIKSFVNSNDSKAFVNKEQVQKIKTIRKGGWANIEGYPLSTIINRKQVNIMNSKLKFSDNTFKWPTTEVKLSNKIESTASNSNDFLNTTSELAKLGYRITGLTREKRWIILQSAVPVLGLKKIAHIIAYNVRLRKKQKNGTVKNAYSIGEWEYDLARLKTKFYKNDFAWPRLN